MTIIRDLREFIELLNKANVPYVIVGGWAVNNYLIPRVTGDFDFFVSRSAQSQKLLRKVLEKFGFASALPPKTRQLLPKGKILMLGLQPNRIDILSHIDGVSFKKAWTTRVRGSLDGIPVNFISLQNLLINKRAANRIKDKADVEGLSKLIKLNSKKQSSTKQRPRKRR